MGTTLYISANFEVILLYVMSSKIGLEYSVRVVLSSISVYLHQYFVRSSSVRYWDQMWVIYNGFTKELICYIKNCVFINLQFHFDNFIVHSFHVSETYVSFGVYYYVS